MRKVLDTARTVSFVSGRSDAKPRRFGELSSGSVMPTSCIGIRSWLCHRGPLPPFLNQSLMLVNPFLRA